MVKEFLVDFEILAVGLEPFGNHLQAHSVPDRNHVDDGFAVLVGFQFHAARVSISLDGMEDDSGALNGFAIGGAQYGDLDARRRWGHLVFSAAMVFLLGTEMGRADGQSKASHEDAKTKERAIKHGSHCKWFEGKWDSGGACDIGL